MIKRYSGILPKFYWLAAFVLLALLPLIVLIATTLPAKAGHGMAWDFALALGFAVIALLLLMFVLTSRFPRLTAPFGIDLVYYFHRQIAIGLLLLAVIHAGILLASEPALATWLLPPAPAYMLVGLLALLCLLLLVAVSALRRRVKLEYETWRRTHLLLAVVGVVAALLHISGVNHYSGSMPMQVLTAIAAATWLVLVLRTRLFKPWSLRRHPWRVVSVTPERGRAVTIELKPQGHDGLHFSPGQFAWLTCNGSPFSMSEHPFSIASSAERRDVLSFTIKALGDFTSNLQHTQAGTTIYVDGPYGTFSVDKVEAEDLFFIAGGIGIVPVMSMLRTLADRNDRRPMTLVYAANGIDDMTFYEELPPLAERLQLTLVLVPAQPPGDWQGKRGVVDHSLLNKYLPGKAQRVHYFLCGPPAMMRATESVLHQCGVQFRQIHLELFNLV